MKLFKSKRQQNETRKTSLAAAKAPEPEASILPRAAIGYQRLEQRRVLSASFIGSAGELILDSFDPGQNLTFAQTNSFINGIDQDSFTFQVDSGSFTGSLANPLFELESVSGGTNNLLQVATSFFGGATNAQISIDGATSTGGQVEFDQAGNSVTFDSLNISNFTNIDRGFSLNAIGDVTASSISVIDSNPLDSINPSASLTINTQGSITAGSIENLIDNPLAEIDLSANGANNDIAVIDRIESQSGSIELSAGDSVQLNSTGQIVSGNLGNTTIISGTSGLAGDSGDQILLADGSRIDVGLGQTNLIAEGDVLVSQITSLNSGDAVSITTGGQIVDNTLAESDNVIAANGRSQFIATGDIGGAGVGDIDIQAEFLEFDTNGSAAISDSDLGITIDRTSRADAGVQLDSNGALTISQNISVGADSSFITNNSNSVGDDLTIDSGAIVSLTSTVGAQLEFIAADDIVFDTGSVTTSPNNHSVVLIADNEGAIDADRGSIINSSGSIATISTNELTAIAYDGIGDLSNPLRTNVDRLVASNTGTGNIQIDEDNSIELVSVQTADGAISVSAVGDIEATNVTSGETETSEDNLDNVNIASALGSINVSNISSADEISLSAFGSISDNPGSQIASASDASFNAGSLVNLGDSAGNLLSIAGNASFTAETISVGADSQLAGIVTPTAASVELGSLTFNGNTTTIVEDDSTSLSGNNLSDELFLTSADQITNQSGAALSVSGQAQFNALTEIVLGNQINDTIDIAKIGLVSNNAHIETDSDLIIDASVPDQTAAAIGTIASNGTQIDQTLFVSSLGSVNQIVGELDATNIGIEAAQFVHLASVSANNQAISISAGGAAALTDATLIQELTALANIENSEVDDQLDQAIALKHQGTLNVTAVTSHLGTDSLAGLTTTQGSVFASAAQGINLFENISASSTIEDPQVTVYSESGTESNPDIEFVGGTIEVNGPTNFGLVNGNQTFANFFDENGDPLPGTSTLLLLNLDGSADQDIVVEYGRIGEAGYRVGFVYDSLNQPGQPVETLNTFVSDPFVASEAFEDAIFQNNPNLFLQIGGNEGGQETFTKTDNFSAEAIILHQDDPNVFTDVTVRNDQNINLFTGSLETAANSLNETTERLFAELDAPLRGVAELPTINAINSIEVRMTVDVPLGSSTPDSSTTVTSSREVQPFESGDLKWVQVQIPISELEEIDGEVRLKDPTKVFANNEEAELNDLDDEIGENEVEKIIDVIETNEESEAGYWYKVFKDYRNRDDELFFYHFKTGETQQSDSFSQPESTIAPSPNDDSAIDIDADENPKADLPDSDFSLHAPTESAFEPLVDVSPATNQSKSMDFENEVELPDQLENSGKSSSISPGSLLMASLLLKKSNARKIQNAQQEQQRHVEPNPSCQSQASQTATNKFSRSDRLKRKIKRLLG